MKQPYHTPPTADVSELFDPLERKPPTGFVVTYRVHRNPASGVVQKIACIAPRQEPTRIKD